MTVIFRASKKLKDGTTIYAKMYGKRAFLSFWTTIRKLPVALTVFSTVRSMTFSILILFILVLPPLPQNGQYHRMIIKPKPRFPFSQIITSLLPHKFQKCHYYFHISVSYRVPLIGLQCYTKNHGLHLHNL